MSRRLIIAGLGPGDPDLRTIAVQRALDGAEQIILRTGIHPGLDSLLADPRTTTCDDLYDSLASFDEVYAAVVERVVSAAMQANVVYAVPGHPSFGERTVAPVLSRCQEIGIPVTVLASVSALDVIATSIGHDLMAENVQLVDATDIDDLLGREPFSGGLLNLSPAKPMLISQVYSTTIASSVKLALTRILPESHEIMIVVAAGVPGLERRSTCPLHDLDHQPVDHLTSVWVPALPLLDASRSPATLHQIAAHLRAPEGCPWDRKQTHESLRTALLEEAYEVVDAIDEDDPEHFAEELGDLLLTVALHTQIAEEAGDFSIEDVYDQINRKLIRRHPHVFGSVTAETPDQVVQTWQSVKAEERRQKGEPVNVVHDSPLDQFPRSMPTVTKLVTLSGSKSTRHIAESESDLAMNLLAAVEAVIGAGIDPDRALDHAYRRRSASGSSEP